MNHPFFAEIIEKVREGTFYLTLHARNEAFNDRIDTDKVADMLLKGEMLEDYPENTRGHSCLILGWESGKAVHFVCGMKDDAVVIITLYKPSGSKWIDCRERRKRQ
jgi:hypothetical protein